MVILEAKSHLFAHNFVPTSQQNFIIANVIGWSSEKALMTRIELDDKIHLDGYIFPIFLLDPALNLLFLHFSSANCSKKHISRFEKSGRAQDFYISVEFRNFNEVTTLTK